MARYTGPAFRKSRRLGFSTLENGKEFAKGKKRTSAPGQHGTSRRKPSNYGIHLTEKQKVRFMYGINERQFSNIFKRAQQMKGNTGLNFLQLLETRLDNVAFRTGYSMSRRGARQLVNHGHILVNGKVIDIPSYTVPAGAKIEIKDRYKANNLVSHAFKQNIYKKDYVKIDDKAMSSVLVRLPERKEMSAEIKEQLIVEYYNK